MTSCIVRTFQPPLVCIIFRNVLKIHFLFQLTGSPHENLARMIFMELSEAWAQFEEEGMKSLY